MKRVSVSREAEADIDQIATYTDNRWGWPQTDHYLDQLEESFQVLSQHPEIGRSCDSIQEGLRRYEVEKHVVLYRSEPGEVLVVSILHQQMIPIKARFEP